MREYKTQMEAAKKGIITPEMQTVATKEYMEPEKLRELVAKGWVAIPANVNHTSLSAEGVGSGLKTKINVNLGISGDCKDYTMEMQEGRHGDKVRRGGNNGSFQLRQDQHFPQAAHRAFAGYDRHRSDVRRDRLP